MAKTKTRSDELTRKYAAALESYLRQGGEAGLQRAYEIGRRALAEGRSILDMVSIHHKAMQVVGEGLQGPPLREHHPDSIGTGSGAPLRSSRTEGENGSTLKVLPYLRPETLRKAGEFFIECMSPFEMTRRAFGEANLALRRLNETLEEQARIIGRELHDEAGQLLAAVHIELDEMARDLPAGRGARLQGIKGLLDQVEVHLRSLAHEIRPTVLDDLGLVAALDSLSQRVAQRTGLRVAVQPFNGARLPARVEVALYRIVQEALNNVTKHARAVSVKIRLRKTRNAVACSIRDNGVGFDPKSLQTDLRSRGLGLRGIEERLRALGGEVQIESRPGQGTKLKMTIPLGG